MEKRLLLAVFLSLVVVLLFQAILNPQAKIISSVGMQSIGGEVVPSKHVDTSAMVQDNATVVIKDKIFSEEISVLNSDGLRIELTNKGGNVRFVEVKDMRYVLPVKEYASLTAFNDKQFQIINSNPKEIIYQYKEANWLIERKYRIEASRLFSCFVTIKNVGKDQSVFSDNLLAFIIDTSKIEEGVKKTDWTLLEYSIKSNNIIIRNNNTINFNNKWNQRKDIKTNWFGFRDRYFATIIEPKFNINTYYTKTVSQDELSIGTSLFNMNILPEQDIKFEFLIYAGPQKLEELKNANNDFEKIMVFSNWGWLDTIAKAIYWLLGITHKIVPIWGLCIIIVSILVYACMYPLTLKSLVAMKRMQYLQPKIKILQEKYNNNPEKLNQEIMELYRKHNVNPLGGCLPMVLQMPIFYGLYQVIWRSIYFKGEKFLWIQDLSLPDHLFKLPGNIPFIGEYFNVLPLLMIGIMILQQHFSSKNVVVADAQQATQQKLMIIFFPIIIGCIFYHFASGLNLYFIVFYLFSTITQWKIAQEKIVG